MQSHTARMRRWVSLSRRCAPVTGRSAGVPRHDQTVAGGGLRRQSHGGVVSPRERSAQCSAAGRPDQPRRSCSSISGFTSSAGMVGVANSGMAVMSIRLSVSSGSGIDKGIDGGTRSIDGVKGRCRPRRDISLGGELPPELSAPRADTPSGRDPDQVCRPVAPGGKRCEHDADHDSDRLFRTPQKRAVPRVGLFSTCSRLARNSNAVCAGSGTGAPASR